MHDYATMTWTELRDHVAARDAPAIIIPIGCLEEHGPHLPLATDSMLARAFAEALVTVKGLDIVVGPLVDFGVSVLTQGFPGTVRVRFDTLRALLVDLFSSCAAWGFTTIIAFTWHGGGSHEIALREAALDVIWSGTTTASFHVLRGVKLFDDPAFAARIKAIAPSAGDHADELETSLMLHVHPSLVRMNEAVREYPELPRFTVIPAGTGYMTHGVMGDATLATPEKGKALFEAILDELALHVQALTRAR